MMLDCASEVQISKKSKIANIQCGSEAFSDSSFQSILLPSNVHVLDSMDFSVSKSVLSNTFELNAYCGSLSSILFESNSREFKTSSQISEQLINSNKN
jgi:hypothetical protein